eukprot:scaffold23376_cov124-Isochrysis_galbana.AAC.7
MNLGEWRGVRSLVLHLCVALTHATGVFVPHLLRPRASMGCYTTGPDRASASSCASVHAIVDRTFRVDLLAGHWPCVPERHPQPQQPVVLGLPAKCDLAMKNVAGHSGLRRMKQQHLREKKIPGVERVAAVGGCKHGRRLRGLGDIGGWGGAGWWPGAARRLAASGVCGGCSSVTGVPCGNHIARVRLAGLRVEARACCPQWVSLGGSVVSSTGWLAGDASDPSKAVSNHEPNPDTSASAVISILNGVVKVAMSACVTDPTSNSSRVVLVPMISDGLICCHMQEWSK